MTATATRGCAPAATPPTSTAFGSISDLFDAFFGGGGAWRRAGGPAQGGDLAVAIEIDLLEAANGAKVRGLLRGGRALRALPRQRRRAGHADRDLRALRRRRAAAGGDPHAVRADGAHDRLRRLPRRRARAQAAVPRVSRPGAQAAQRELEVDVPAGIADGQRIRLGGRGHAGEAGAPAGDLYVLVRVREDERFVREGDDLITALDVAAPLAALGATLEAPTLEGTRLDRACRRAPSRARC